MEINILKPADTAVPTMRALPWLSSLTADWRQLMSDRSGAAKPAAARLRAMSTPVVAAYRVSGVIGSAVCAGNTQVHASALVLGTNADHKFSTRVGPPSSPPV